MAVASPSPICHYGLSQLLSGPGLDDLLCMFLFVACIDPINFGWSPNYVQNTSAFCQMVVGLRGTSQGRDSRYRLSYQPRDLTQKGQFQRKTPQAFK